MDCLIFVVVSSNRGAVHFLPSKHRVIVVGAGAGGLAAALDLQSRGYAVSLLERAAAVGGKARALPSPAGPIDAGPTVVTMRPVFEALFERAGARLEERVPLERAEVLARHAWPSGARLDLFADAERSVEAVRAAFGAGEAAGLERFMAHTRTLLELTESRFIDGQRPTLLGALRAFGLSGLRDLTRIDSTRTLASALTRFFKSPELRQLFGRYATYVGTSPYEAPGTLALVARVEMLGVWRCPLGLRRLLEAERDLFVERGGDLRLGCGVRDVLTADGAVTGVALDDGRVLPAAGVVLNADAASIAAGHLGRAVVRAVEAPRPRSLSARVWTLAARAEGFPLTHHTVLFGADYAEEMGALARGTEAADATLYVCAQDRPATEVTQAPTSGLDRFLILENAAARGDVDAARSGESEGDPWRSRWTKRMAAFGLSLTPAAPGQVTTPTDFEALFPATGGALYGAASAGMWAPFKRASARTSVAGLYLCGGSAHPGAGVPMATLSGVRAAEALDADFRSTAPRQTAATPGSTSTSSVTTAAAR
jgi:1-hydroxycarotenoid 3,4-desaturase